MILYGCLATGTVSLSVPSLVRLPYTAAHGIERASRTKKVRARTALRSTRRHFINNRPIRAKLREELPHCLRNKQP